MSLAAIDRLDLSDLVHRYADAVDRRRVDDVVALFTADAQFVSPDPPEHLDAVKTREGHPGVRIALAGLDGLARTHHGILGEVFRIDGDVAVGSITGVARHWMERDDRVTDVTWYLRYADEYVRTADGWRIRRRALTIDAIEHTPARVVRA
ncbi:nuclear transport factor 2 family protein [Microbacterium luticocti]|uniref:nuclear transport factor 2 family protein n=1 Tax=Microbacterium luticocti TaxID=451764 RepID=UPI000419FA22|nr:nuclear transport factor 2 family protein [Microbacterium luticocti]